LLTSEEKKTNTHVGIIFQFDALCGNKIELGAPISTLIYQIKNNEPTEKFAKKYLEEAQFFYKKVNEFRTKTVSNEN